MLHIEYARKEWERKREEVFKRDNYICRICGEPLGESRSVHHKCYPDKSLNDLLAAHVSCHSRKHYQERKREESNA